MQSLVFVLHVTCSLDISEVFLLQIHSGAKRVPRLLYENHSPLPSLPPYSSFCLQAIVSLHWHHPLPLSSKCISICKFLPLVFTRIVPYSSLKFKLYFYLCICSDYIQTDCNPRPQVQIRRSLMSMAVSSALWRAFCPDMSPQ